jgi:hypothetical protein
MLMRGQNLAPFYTPQERTASMIDWSDTSLRLTGWVLQNNKSEAEALLPPQNCATGKARCSAGFFVQGKR